MREIDTDELEGIEFCFDDMMWIMLISLGKYQSIEWKLTGDQY